METRRRSVIYCAAILVAACTTVNEPNSDRTTQQADFDWQLPPGFMPPPTPETNPATTEKFQLGRILFYDERLSVNGQGSCASCHKQKLAFTDGRSQAMGVTGEIHSRSSMSLINVAYNNSYTWASRDVRTLEQQIPIPIFSEQPVELGLHGQEMTLVETLRSDAETVFRFQQAYPEAEDPVSVDNTVKALATFVRSIIAADSAFDRLLYGDDQNAMSDSAKRGMRLFFSDQLKCSQCHEGQNLAGGQFDSGQPPEQAEFHNTALYNVAGRNNYPEIDAGLRIESGQSKDDGKFRAPTLRNIAVTAPYMHDGSIATLSEAIDHYASGGRTIFTGPYAGIGNDHTNKSQLLSGFSLSASEKGDLLSFLNSLTDYAVLDDPRFSDFARKQPMVN